MENNKINIILGIKEEIIFTKIAEFLLNNLTTVNIINLKDYPEELDHKAIYVIEDNLLPSENHTLPSDAIILIKKDAAFVNKNNYKVIYFPLRLDDLLAYLQQLIDKIDNNITIKNINLKNTKKGWIVKNLSNKSSTELTDKEGLLLKTLLKSYPNSLPRSALLKTVWHITSPEVETHTLESHISSVRKKLQKITYDKNPTSNLEIIKDDEGYLIKFT